MQRRANRGNLEAARQNSPEHCRAADIAGPDLNEQGQDLDHARGPGDGQGNSQRDHYRRPRIGEFELFRRYCSNDILVRRRLRLWRVYGVGGHGLSPAKWRASFVRVCLPVGAAGDGSCVPDHTAPVGRLPSVGRTQCARISSGWRATSGGLGPAQSPRFS
jgi:hypothetical protein